MKLNPRPKILLRRLLFFARAAALRAKQGRFSDPNEFGKQSQLVDAFWSAHLAK